MNRLTDRKNMLHPFVVTPGVAFAVLFHSCTRQDGETCCRIRSGVEHHRISEKICLIEEIGCLSRTTYNLSSTEIK